MSKTNNNTHLDNSMTKVAIIELGTEYYGLDISNVKTILPYTQPSKIPNVPSFVKGVMNLRGEVIPVKDLREILGYEKFVYKEEDVFSVTEGTDGEQVKKDTRRIIILEIQTDQSLQEKTQVGLIIDKVISVSDILDTDMQSIENVNIKGSGEFIMAIAKFTDNNDCSLISILDAKKLITL